MSSKYAVMLSPRVIFSQISGEQIKIKTHYGDPFEKGENFSKDSLVSEKEKLENFQDIFLCKLVCTEGGTLE